MIIKKIWWLMYSRSSNSCFIQCFITTLMREQKSFLARAPVCGVSHLPHVLWVSSGSPVSSHLPNMCRWGELACLHCASLSECECECGCWWPSDGRTPVRVVSPSTLSCQKSNQYVGKSLSYLFFLNVCRAHTDFNVYLLEVSL